jgi:amino acid transporter
VACLILNRTIGTGIFAQPSNVLYLTGSPSVAIILWIVGGLIILSITLSWLELGLTVPRYFVREIGDVRSAPRSGGDKNYLEYLYQRPRLFMSCLFGITFILFGNLAGNSIQFGIYMQHAISPHCTEDDACFNKAAVLLWAIGILTFCSFLNIATRKLFIGLNNGFAAAKLLLVAATALLGIVYGTTHGDGCRTNMAWSNRGAGGGFGDIVLAMFYGMYSYTGFEQPFYVLAEVERPQDTFAKYVILALGSVMILFPLTNFGFFCVVPYHGPESVPNNMALKFFDMIARNGDPGANTIASQRAISVVLALIIFGTIMAQTFTGSRVKQEIAKEAIIPFALFIATAKDSLHAQLQAWRSGTPARPIDRDYIIMDHPEQVPMAATLLHLIFAVALVILVGAPIKPSHAYRVLTYLRIFSIIVVLGLLTVAGLAYLKIDSWIHGRHAGTGERDETGGGSEVLLAPGRRPGWLGIRNWYPWLDPFPTFLATIVLAFLSVAVFAEPSQIRTEERDVPYWVSPLAGWLVLLVGVLWWAGLRAWQWKTGTRTEVLRRPEIYIDADGQAVLRAELIEHRRGARLPQDDSQLELESIA